MARDFLGNIRGPQGPKGDKGDTGDTGPQGPKGDDGNDYEAYGYVYGTFTGDITDSLTDREKANLSISQQDTTQDFNNNEITLSQGYWLVNLNTRITPIYEETQILFYIMRNNTREALLDIANNDINVGSISIVFYAENNDKLWFEIGSKNSVSFSSLDANRFSVKKLGG